MVKAELYYNPYKIETKVKFNGNEPRINSLIEKYENKRLQEWIDEVPILFKEELNGYDFDLSFIGTDLEYDAVKNAFDQAVSDDEFVNLTHTETLMDRKNKLKQIKEFLEWLSGEQSEYFDYNEFYNTNEDFLNSVFPFMVLNGTEEDIKDINTDNLSVEFIDDFDMLLTANLIYNPILICVDEDYADIIHKAVDVIQKNNTVYDKQVFFLVREQMLADKIKRFIEDLGVPNPNIVISSGDNTIVDYMDAYPLCQYIHDVLSLFRTTSDDISYAIKLERDKIEESHREEYDKLENLEAAIERVETALIYFQEYSFGLSKMELGYHKSYVLDKIAKWKEKSVVVTGDDAATKEVNHLIDNLFKWHERFFRDVQNEAASLTIGASNDFKKAFLETELDPRFVKDEVVDFTRVWDASETISNHAQNMLLIRQERWVEEKHFKFMQKAEVQNVLKAEYDVFKWRNMTRDKMESVMSDEIDSFYTISSSYFSELKKYYLEVLNSSKQQFIQEKELILSQLSDDVKDVENEKIWADKLSDKIDTLERT